MATTRTAKVELAKDGSILSTASSMALSDDDVVRIQELERKGGLNRSAQAALKKEIQKLDMELAENPLYKKREKLRAKIAMLKKVEQETTIQLNGAYESATRGMRKGRSMFEVFNEVLPDVEVKPKRRGIKS